MLKGLALEYRLAFVARNLIVQGPLYVIFYASQRQHNAIIVIYIKLLSIETACSVGECLYMIWV